MVVSVLLQDALATTSTAQSAWSLYQQRPQGGTATGTTLDLVRAQRLNGSYSLTIVAGSPSNSSSGMTEYPPDVSIRTMITIIVRARFQPSDWAVESGISRLLLERDHSRST